ncbi:hypothetical protein Hdeb2414_s0024g00649751 [Helianthus debilis subsp. tardiflorus]
MHNVQHLKHQETQTNYPSTGSSTAVHFLTFSHGSQSKRLIFSSHGSTFPFHSLSQLLTKLHQTPLSLTLGDSRTSCQISQDAVS